MSRTFGPGYYDTLSEPFDYWEDSGGGFFDVQRGAALQGGSNGIWLLDGPWQVTCNGTVSGESPNVSSSAFGYGWALHLGASASVQHSKITVGATGSLTGVWNNSSYGGGIWLEQSADISNSGSIAAGNPRFGGGILIGHENGEDAFTAQDSFNIVNKVSGTISAWSNAHTNTLFLSAIVVYPSLAAIHLTNAGMIQGGSALDLESHSVIKNSGQILGDILLSDYADRLTNTGTITGYVDLDGGDDLLSNTGAITGSIDLGNGDDTFTNSGTVTGSVGVGFGYGNDTFTNSGTVNGNVDLGNGDDKFTNNGTVVGDIQLSSGIIDLGAGNDTLIGGAGSEAATDNAGKDTYKLGGGGDYFFASLGSGDGQTDVVDGGAGYDTYYSGYDANWNAVAAGVKVDLGAAVTIGSIALQANTGQGANGEKDTITHFEAVMGTGFGDVLAGSNGANQLLGEGGNDDIYGAGGGDILYGGSGADTFWYTRLTDSTVAAPGRDIIMDFNAVAGQDRIDLHRIDANSGASGDQAFSFLGNSAFSGAAGQLRFGFNQGDTIVSGDVNGDGKADFSIALDGQINLNAGNFVL